MPHSKDSPWGVSTETAAYTPAMWGGFGNVPTTGLLRFYLDPTFALSVFCFAFVPWLAQVECCTTSAHNRLSISELSSPRGVSTTTTAHAWVGIWKRSGDGFFTVLLTAACTSASALSNIFNRLCPTVETPRGASPRRPQHAHQQCGWKFENVPVTGFITFF